MKPRKRRWRRSRPGRVCLTRGKVDTTSGRTDKGDGRGFELTGLAQTTNPRSTNPGSVTGPLRPSKPRCKSSFATELDKKGPRSRRIPHNDLTPLTPAQIEADNYKVGKVRLAGKTSPSKPAGAKRREEWPALKDHMAHPGHHKGADGELLTSSSKRNAASIGTVPSLWSTRTPDGTFDETKAIAGAKPSVAEAREIYKRNYQWWKGLRDCQT